MKSLPAALARVPLAAFAWPLATVMSIVAGPAPVLAETTPVEIQVQSKSWIPNSSFDLERLQSQCRDADLELVPVQKTHSDRPAIAVTYTEAQGMGFSMFGVGTPVGYGTEITYALKLLMPPSGKARLALSAKAETPAGLPKEQFHDAAKEAFHATPAFRFSCDAVAAGLGSFAAQRRLLPWALVESQGLAVLDTTGFVPASAAERAFLAAARRDFASLRTMGPDAADPLLLLLQNSATSRDGIGLLAPSTPANARVLADAVTTLVSLNDERTPNALADLLSDYGDARTEPDGAVTPVLETVIKALGVVGTAFSLPLLEEWQNGNGRLAAAAREAVASVQKRVMFQ